jgi:hypothetical protein
VTTVAAGLRQQMGQEGRRQPDRAQQVDVQGLLDDRQVEGAARQRLGLHDAGVVDDDIEGGVVGDDLRGDRLDGFGIGDVEDDEGHARIGGDDLLQRTGATTGDDDRGALRMQGLGEGAADAGSAAGDQDGVF